MSQAKDWLQALFHQKSQDQSELYLGLVKAGDVVRVKTQKSVYEFQMLEGRDAEIRASSGKEYGVVRIMGCKFGDSSTIKPNSLFCGGNLEFTYQQGEYTHTSTKIVEIDWVRKS